MCIHELFAKIINKNDRTIDMIKQTKRPNIKNLIVINFVDHSLLGLAERDGYSGLGVDGSWLRDARQDEKEWFTILRITLLAMTLPIPSRIY